MGGPARQRDRGGVLCENESWNALFGSLGQASAGTRRGGAGSKEKGPRAGEASLFSLSFFFSNSDFIFYFPNSIANIFLDFQTKIICTIKNSA